MKVRHLFPSDIPEVMAIEQASFADPISDVDFANTIAAGGVNAVVAQLHTNDVVGFLVFDFNSNRHFLRVISIAVAPAWRRKKVGRLMLSVVMKNLAVAKAVVQLADADLPHAHQFFGSMGFTAKPIKRDRQSMCLMTWQREDKYVPPSRLSFYFRPEMESPDR